MTSGLHQRCQDKIMTPSSVHMCVSKDAVCAPSCTNRLKAIRTTAPHSVHSIPTISITYATQQMVHSAIGASCIFEWVCSLLA